MNCPKCKEEVNEKQARCHICGYDLSPNHTVSARIWAVIGIIAVIIANIALLIYIKR